MTTRRLLQSLVATIVALLCATSMSRGADPDFVGSLALAVDPQGAQALGLSEETVEKLKDLCDRREDEVLKLVNEIKTLPPAEQAARLAPFVAESERMGLELLTLEQREKLSQLKIARGGMSTLADPEVARVLSLSDVQKQQVQTLFEQRAKDMTLGGENQRRLTQALYERRLASVLNDDQRGSWEKMAGLGPGTLQVAAATDEKPPMEEDAENQKPDADQIASNDEERSDSGDEQDDSQPRATGGLLKFSFKNAKWEDVFTWFAEHNDLSMQIDPNMIPQGTFNYQDPLSYTPSEALDILNSVLLSKGYSLIRRHRMLMVLDLEQPIPPELVPLVDVSELDDLSDFEIVKCVFHLAQLTPADAEAEINKLLGGGRTAVVLPQSQQVLVTDTVKTLRLVRDMIESVENPDGQSRKVRIWKLKYVLADDVFEVGRNLIGLDEEELTNERINMLTDALRTTIFATGAQEALDLLDEVVQTVDVKPEQNLTSTAAERPELETYLIQKADIEVVIMVLQQLLAGLPDTRMTSDKTSNKIIISARKEDHQLVEETIAKLEGEARHTEVIQCSKADPQSVVSTVNKFFGTTSSSETSAISGFQISSDLNFNTVLVYGTDAEIARVNEIVEQMEGPKFPGAETGNVRMIQISKADMENLMPQLEAFWPQVSKNKSRIQFIVPTNRNGSTKFRAREVTPDPGEIQEDNNRERPSMEIPGRQNKRPTTPAPDTSPAPDSTYRPRSSPRVAERSPAARANDYVVLVSAPAQNQEDDQSDQSDPSDPSDQPDQETPAEQDQPETQDATAEDSQDTAEEPSPDTKRPADIIISMTPNGLMVTCSDPEELERFVNFVNSIVPQAAGTGLIKRDVAIFYLRYVQAEVAANQLKDILGGTSTAGGTSAISDMASNLIGGQAGGIFGALMGGGGGGGGSEVGPIKAGNVSIVTDPRLNRLIVQGNTAELTEIEEILQVLDQPDSDGPGTVWGGIARIMLLEYASAEKVAAIIEDAYADRLAGGGGGQGGQPRQPSPEDFIRMLRGGGRGGNEQNARGEAPKMTIAVDADNNAIIVRAPQSLYLEIKDLVALLDTPNDNAGETFEVVALDNNGSLLVNALKNLTGQPGGTAASTTAQRNRTGQQGGANAQQGVADQFRMMQAFQQFQQGGGGGGGFGRGGGGGGGRGGGGFGGGGFGGGGRGGGGFGGGGRGGGGFGGGGRGGN